MEGSNPLLIQQTISFRWIFTAYIGFALDAPYLNDSNFDSSLRRWNWVPNATVRAFVVKKGRGLIKHYVWEGVGSRFSCCFGSIFEGNENSFERLWRDVGEAAQSWPGPYQSTSTAPCSFKRTVCCTAFKDSRFMYFLSCNIYTSSDPEFRYILREIWVVASIRCRSTTPSPE